MKKHYSTRNHETFRSVLCFFSLIIFSFTVLQGFAQKQNTSHAVVRILQSEDLNGLPAFRLFIEKPTNTPYDIRIEDEEGFVLFAEQDSKAAYSKTFQVDLPNKYDFTLTLTVSSKNNRKDKQVYHINGGIRQVHDLIVSRQE